MFDFHVRLFVNQQQQQTLKKIYNKLYIHAVNKTLSKGA